MTSSSGLGDEEVDPLKEARAYNTSILFMLTMPYVILAFAGTAMFWAVRRNRSVQAQSRERPEPGFTATVRP